MNRMALFVLNTPICCLTLCCVATCCLAPSCRADSGSSGQIEAVAKDTSTDSSQVLIPPSASANGPMAAAFADLTSPDFSTRQRAVRQLTQLSPDQISQMVALAESAENLEVTQRMLLLLEQFYRSSDTAIVTAASESLEAAVTHPRWAIAEAARDILDRNWVQRFVITQNELRKCGIFFNKFQLESGMPGRPGGANLFFGGPVDSTMLQINIDQRWSGGERGLELLDRLSDMADPNGFLGTARMGVYLIDGHPLDEKEVTRLKVAFGDSRVVSRGRVCLGITHDPTGSDSIGCRVAEVRPGTSAHKGGIQSQDLIVAVGETRIRDFDHLVDHLKDYEIGTVVKMEILRGGSPFPRFDAPRQPFDGPPNGLENDNPYHTRRITLNVRLLGWDSQDDDAPPQTP